MALGKAMGFAFAILAAMMMVLGAGEVAAGNLAAATLHDTMVPAAVAAVVANAKFARALASFLYGSDLRSRPHLRGSYTIKIRDEANPGKFLRTTLQPTQHLKGGGVLLFAAFLFFFTFGFFFIGRRQAPFALLQKLDRVF
jgi:hypothetical protein